MQTPFTNLTFCIRTFGCQMNKHDSERIAGMLEGLGALPVEAIEDADIVAFMTCCVREAADTRLYGQVASLKNVPLRTGSPLAKRIVAVGGCIGQRDGEKLVEELPHLDVVFGTHNLGSLPRLIEAAVEEGGHQVEVLDAASSFPTELPTAREHDWAAWLPITIGCNNFCSYCIVPYVRGRERSRRPEDILSEVRELSQAGYRDITLLGQNVNSYGKDLGLPGVDFAWLLEQVNAVPGDFLIRFMTSHPKDASERLFDTMAACEKVAPHLHLPFQAGNDRVLRAMHRGYTREHYLELIRSLRARIPDIVLTSDVIVGFPGETTEEFEDTLKVLEEVEFDALFTFIYSPRKGTPAAELPDPLSKEEKAANFQRLVDLQNAISARKQAAYVGKTMRCLVDVLSEDPRHNLNARTAGGRLVHFSGDEALLGQFVDLKITDASTWALFGELA